MKTKNAPSKRAVITGWVLSAIPILFLLFDSFGKLTKPDMVVQTTVELGYAESSVTTIGIILLVFTIIYSIPRFSFFGAILLTGFLGGAVATNFRVENPLFSHILFPVYLAVFIWAGLYFRDKRIRNLII